jgi:hypothetical protein
MSRELPTTDFRAIRIVLEDSDFALAPEGPPPPPKDLIDEETWGELFTLPDTVAYFTSNDHGRELRFMSKLWGECINQLSPEIHDEISSGIMNASDEFQAATFNALGGYYRVAIDCLRSALESIIITTYCQARRAEKEFKKWQAGHLEIGFGGACDKLIGAQCARGLSKLLVARCGTGLFDQRQKGKNGGWVRQLYSGLSDYSHCRPAYQAADMWGGSNGPIYEEAAFKWTYRLWLQTLGTCFILVKVVRPETTMSPLIQDLFNQSCVREICVLITAAGLLWPAA